MIGGSFLYTGTILLFFAITIFMSFLLLNRMKLAEGEGLERALTIAQGYVGEESEQEDDGLDTSKIAEIRAIFWKNWKFGFLLYIAAVLLMNVAPNLRFIIVLATGMLTVVNAVFMGYTIALVQQLELSIPEYFISLLPHGILEYAAIFSIYGHSAWVVGAKGQFSLIGSLTFFLTATFVLLLAAFVEVKFTSKWLKSRVQTEAA